METAITVPTAEQLTAIAISAIIASAVIDARGVQSELKRHRIYNAAKGRICKLTLTPDEYQRAIRLLTDALEL